MAIKFSKFRWGKIATAILTTLIIVLISFSLSAGATGTDHQAWDNLTESWRQDNLKGYRTGDYVPHRFRFDVSDLEGSNNDIIFRFEGDRLQGNTLGYVDARHFYIVSADFEPDGTPPFGSPVPFVFEENDDVFEISHGSTNGKYFVEFKVINKEALEEELNGGLLAFYWEYRLSSNANEWTGNLKSTIETDGYGKETINFNASKDIIAPEPSINVEKRATSITDADDVSYDDNKYRAVGDKITYTFEVTNNGDVTLSSVTLTEDEFTGEGDLPEPVFVGSNQESVEGTLKPGETAEYTATYVVTQSDIIQGDIYNKVTATGEYSDPDNNGTKSVEDSDDETVYAEQDASIFLTKEASPTAVTKASDVITYNYTVTNTGYVTLTGIAVEDDQLGSITIYEDLGAEPLVEVTTLAPGESAYGETNYTVTQADIDAGEDIVNVAEVTTDQEATDEATATVTIATELDVRIEKEASPTMVTESGHVITYTYKVTNTGDATLTGILVEDDQLGTINLHEDLEADPLVEVTTLAPGESAYGEANYTVTQADIDAGEDIVNVVVVETDQEVTDEATAIVTIDAKADVMIEKKVAPNSITEPGTIFYTYTVTNTGNMTLTGIEVYDDHLNQNIILYVSSDNLDEGPVAIDELAPGKSATGTATYYVTQADIDAGEDIVNVVVVDTDQDVTDSAIAIVTLLKPVEPPEDPEVGISLIKSADPQTYSEAGEKITYTFTVENTGEVKLTNIAITEDAFSGSGELPDPEFVSSSQDSAEGTLIAGESATYTAVYSVTQADIDAGYLENAATVTGYDPDKAPVTDSDDETIEAVQNVSIGIDKEADVAIYDAVGAIINYTIEVTNRGNITLTEVELKDDLLTDLKLDDDSDFTGSLGDMAPGDSVTVTGSYTITQSDLDQGSIENIATVTGYFEGVKYEKSDKAIVKADQKAEIKLTKRANVRTYSNEGDLIKYTFKIENTGNVTLYNVKLNDPTAVLSGGPIAELAPGEVDRDTFTGTYKITRSDLYAWKVVNKAYVKAQDPNDRDVTGYDSATVTAVVDFPEVDLPTPPTGGNMIPLLAIALVLTGSGIALKKYKR